MRRHEARPLGRIAMHLDAGGRQVTSKSNYGDSQNRSGSAGFLLFARPGGTAGELQHIAKGLGEAGFVTRALTPDGGVESSNDGLARQTWITQVDGALSDMRNSCEHVFVAGLSTSARLALEAAVRRPDIVRGVVSYAPVLTAPAYGQSWLVRLGAIASARLFGSPRLERISRAISQPALIVHGRDDRGPTAHDVVYLQRNLGGRVDVVVLNDRDHLITASRQRELVLARTEAFARRILTMIGKADRAVHAGPRRSAAAS